MPIEKDGDRKTNLPKPQTFGSSLISFILFLLLFNFLVLPSMRPRPIRVPYSTFVR
jgi:cell division protease FtsH